jgi:hypothetical protein
MPMPAPVPSRLRSALLAVALFAAPAVASAQERAAAGARLDSIVVTASSVRVRSGPSMQSLSIEEFSQGTVFPLAPAEYHTNDWLGIALDGRVAFIPRYAVALKLRPPAPVNEPVVATRTAAPAPVTVATVPVPVVPTPVPTAAPTPAPADAAPPRPAPTATPAAAPAVAERAPLPVTSPPDNRVAERAPAHMAEPPAVSARRTGIDLTVGLLGSVTREPADPWTPPLHVAGLSFIGARYRGWGVYVAPELGNGGGYRSTMLGGGLSRDLLSVHLLRVTALAGYTTYAQTVTAVAGAAPPATQSLQGPSLGGMVSIPLLGPVRLAYRGQYVMGQLAGTPVHITRYSAGLLF